MFYSCKIQFREKNPVFPIGKFLFFAQARNMVMSQHLTIHFLLHQPSSGRLRKVKNKGKFQTFSSKSGRGRLQEVPPNIVIWLGNFWYFGKLVAQERWSLTKGGRNRRFDCITIFSTSVHESILCFRFKLCWVTGVCRQTKFKSLIFLSPLIIFLCSTVLTLCAMNE